MIGSAMFRAALIVVMVCWASVAESETPIDEVGSGCHGGAGGGRFGVTVRSNGEIVRWHASNRFEDPDEFVMRIDRELAEGLIDEVGRLELASVDYNRSGDMTCSLMERREDVTNRSSWPMGDVEAPAQIRSLARKIRALVNLPMNPPVGVDR